jgi:hypothetical protein
MEKQIREIIAYHCGGTYEAKQKATEQILNLFNVSNCDNTHCIDGVVDEVYGEKIYCSNCEDK